VKGNDDLLKPLELLHLAMASAIGIEIQVSNAGLAKLELDKAKATSPEFKGLIIRATEGSRDRLWILKGKRPPVELTEAEWKVVEELRKNGLPPIPRNSGAPGSTDGTDGPAYQGPFYAVGTQD
jgi:hypothetical protein